MLAEEFALYLESLGLVTYDPTGITGDTFLEVMPPSPDEVVVLTEYAGRVPDVRLPYDSPGLQVRVRGTRDPRTGREKISAIYDALHGLSGVTLPNGTKLVACLAKASPHPMGRDANGRHEYTLSFDLEIRHSTTHRPH